MDVDAQVGSLAFAFVTAEARTEVTALRLLAAARPWRWAGSVQLGEQV